MSPKLIELAANCKDWARRRQRKAPAKMQLRLDPHNFQPSVAIVDTAGQLDEPPTRELCVGPLSGVIVVFDKGVELRRIETWGEIDGQTRRMVF